MDSFVSATMSLLPIYSPSLIHQEAKEYVDFKRGFKDKPRTRPMDEPLKLETFTQAIGATARRAVPLVPPEPLQLAVTHFCLQCRADLNLTVAACPETLCPLWPHRFG